MSSSRQDDAAGRIADGHLFDGPGRILRRGFLAASRLAPGLGPSMQRGAIRTAYTLVSALMRKRDDVTFLNYGYASLAGNGDTLALQPEDQPNRYAAQLYHRVAGARELTGFDVLEVGCGRGGGSSFIVRYMQPRSLTAVDLSATAVQYCRRRHRVAGATFRQGNAEELPFASDSFEAVVNVESSHCYPNFERFVHEVFRVLKPGGHFLFADVRHRDAVDQLKQQLRATFDVIEAERITPNVFRALELDSSDRKRLIEDAPRLLRRPLLNFAAVSGTPVFEAFRTNEFEYYRFVLQKPDGTGVRPRRVSD
jgi:ubiquinone/menaquinone biosynthesis C-methylase UbiE